MLHTTEILYHHIICLWKKLLSENAPTEGDSTEKKKLSRSYNRVKEHP